MKIYYSIILYKSKKLRDNTHPIMIRISFNKKRKYYATGVSALEKYWDSEMERLRGRSNKEKNFILEQYDSNVRNILDHFRINEIPFSFEKFSNKLIGGINGDVFLFFDEQINLLAKKGKIGNKDVYTVAKNRLQAFHKNKQLSFSEITPAFLDKFEGFLISKGSGKGGVNNYFRTIRALYNKAIAQGVTSQEFYPFKNKQNSNGYDMSKLKATYAPKSLSLEDLEKIKNFNIAKHPHLQNSYNIAMFTYYSKGMNFTDIANLRWLDIYNNRISYMRKKTGTQFTISISEMLQKILDDYSGVHPVYVFNILNDFHRTEQQKKDRIKKCRYRFNKDLKEIGELLNLKVELTSYVFRHTYATTLKRKGVSVELISQSMGHKNVEVTNHYLKSFENEEIDKLDDFL